MAIPHEVTPPLAWLLAFIWTTHALAARSDPLELLARGPVPVRAWVYVILLVAILLFSAPFHPPFIYFQF
jgi:hypothetical protein